MESNPKLQSNGRSLQDRYTVDTWYRPSEGHAVLGESPQRVTAAPLDTNVMLLSLIDMRLEFASFVRHSLTIVLKERRWSSFRPINPLSCATRVVRLFYLCLLIQ